MTLIVKAYTSGAMQEMQQLTVQNASKFSLEASILTRGGDKICALVQYLRGICFRPQACSIHSSFLFLVFASSADFECVGIDFAE